MGLLKKLSSHIPSKIYASRPPGSYSTCESTTKISTRGHDAGSTRAHTARPTRPGRIPPSWTGRTTCRPPMVTLWWEEYAAGFKLDQCGRFHELDGSETARAYQRVRTLREQYGRYQGQGEGQPPGLPSAIRLPHT